MLRVRFSHGVRHSVLLCALGLTACSSPMPSAPHGSSWAATPLRFEPPAPAHDVPAVVRIHVAVDPRSSALPELLLLAGPVSEYQLGRIRAGQISAALSERQVPSLTWSDKPGELVVAPTAPLVPGQGYVLAAQGLGHAGSFVVSAEPRPYFSRLWPPPREAARLSHVVYCSALARAVPHERVELSPGAVAVELVPGIDQDGTAADRCFHFSVDTAHDRAPLLPPPELAGASVDPSALLPGAPAPVTASCELGEQPFATGCARIYDDRIRVRSPAEPRLWVLRGGGLEAYGVSEPGRSWLVRGLPPSAQLDLQVRSVDLAGGTTSSAVHVTTLAPEPHIVINEVLANPAGAEPGQEWLELVNDGASSVDLASYTLHDAAGSSALPSYELPPGFVVLLASEAFVRPADGDVPVDESCPVLRLPKLGRSGISNSGERLELRSPSGALVSTFPALRSEAAGVSVARAELWAPDDELGGFGPHASPGASPCAPNAISR